MSGGNLMSTADCCFSELETNKYSTQGFGTSQRKYRHHFIKK